MSHKIYTTEAIVLGSKDFGEANRWYFLLTPDFGLIVARAQGVRELKSKLRGHLALFSLCQISLVRGREYWRLIGAEEIDGEARRGCANGLGIVSEDLSRVSSCGARDLRASKTRVASLLRRLLPEAGADPALFAVVKQNFYILPSGEVNLVWNILRLLGYIAERNPPAGRQVGDTPENILIQEINQALSHSQL